MKVVLSSPRPYPHPRVPMPHRWELKFKERQRQNDTTEDYTLTLTPSVEDLRTLSETCYFLLQCSYNFCKFQIISHCAFPPGYGNKNTSLCLSGSTGSPFLLSEISSGLTPKTHNSQPQPEKYFIPATVLFLSQETSSRPSLLNLLPL